MHLQKFGGDAILFLYVCAVIPPGFAGEMRKKAFCRKMEACGRMPDAEQERKNLKSRNFAPLRM